MKTGFMDILRILAAFCAVWVAVRFLLPLFLPFVLGLGLALAAEPLAGGLVRRGAPRGLAAGIGVTVTFFLLVIAVLFLGALALQQLRLLTGVLPDLEQAARSGLTLLQQWGLSLTDRLPQNVRPLVEENLTAAFSDGTAFVEQGVRFFLGLAGNLLTQVPDSALTVGTGIISAYLFSAKLPSLRSWVRHKLSRERLAKLVAGAKKLRLAVAGWLTAQCKLMGVTFALLLAGFLLLRIAHGPLWAAVVALVDALPVLGTGTVLIPWAVVSFLQGNVPRAIGLGGLYLTVSVTRSMLEPRLLGHHLGLDPLVTLMAVYVGFQLWGFPGMLLAPMMAVALAQLNPGKS